MASDETNGTNRVAKTTSINPACERYFPSQLNIGRIRAQRCIVPGLARASRARLRIAVVLSLLLWIAVLVAGRFLAFIGGWLVPRGEEKALTFGQDTASRIEWHAPWRSDHMMGCEIMGGAMAWLMPLLGLTVLLLVGLGIAALAKYLLAGRAP